MLKWCEIAMFPWPVFIPLDISYNLQSVGQMLGGAVEPGCHYPYDAESGVNSTEEEEKLLTKLEIDTGAGKGTSIPKKKPTKKPSEILCQSQPRFHLSSFYPCSSSSRSIFFSTDECDGKRGWEASKGVFKLITDANVNFWIHWCLEWKKKKRNFGL